MSGAVSPVSASDPRRARGFTLVELVMVLLVAGVLAVVALPKFFDRDVFRARGFFEESLNAARYAHTLASVSGCDVQLVFNGGYALMRRAGGCESGAFSIPVPHPGRPGAFSAGAPPGIGVAPATSLYFDRLGRPRDDAGVLLSAPASVDVGGHQLTIEPETGFVHET